MPYGSGRILDPPLAAALAGLVDNGQTPSLAALALKLCDNVVTVSPSYRDELVAGSLPLHASYGLFTQSVQRKLHGFVNGIDVATWGRPAEKTPEERLATILRDKSEAAATVRAHAGLLDGRPLALMMCRLVRQKGIDLFIGEGETLLPRILRRFNIVVCGQPGEEPERIDTSFRRLADAYPGAFAYLSDYDNELGKLLFKAADIFLFPSLFEPCGLTQMYAMAQGTIPVARATGGLKDTIIDEATHPGRGTGFLFTDFSPEAFFTKLEQAGEVLADADRWTALMLRAMDEDHSWERRAAPYHALFSSCTREVSS